MTGIGKMLVPVDFSEASKKAMGYGIVLAKEFEASLIAAHIIELSPPIAYTFPEDSFRIQQNQREEVRGKLKDLIPENLRESITG
jgi:nucleotide-binding universal stress UspA family protein